MKQIKTPYLLTAIAIIELIVTNTMPYSLILFILYGFYKLEVND